MGFVDVAADGSVFVAVEVDAIVIGAVNVGRAQILSMRDDVSWGVGSIKIGDLVSPAKADS